MTWYFAHERAPVAQEGHQAAVALVTAVALELPARKLLTLAEVLQMTRPQEASPRMEALTTVVHGTVRASLGQALHLAGESPLHSIGPTLC